MGVGHTQRGARRLTRGHNQSFCGTMGNQLIVPERGEGTADTALGDENRSHSHRRHRTRRRRRWGRRSESRWTTDTAAGAAATATAAAQDELYLTSFLQHDPHAYELMEGQTALHLAALAGRLDLVKHLIQQHNVSVNGLNHHAGRTALAEVVVAAASRRGNALVDVITYLLVEAGANPLALHADGTMPFITFVLIAVQRVTPL